MRRICVFCGSTRGARPGYAAAARALARALVARARSGSSTAAATSGLMGVVADAMLAAGGDVIGVIPARARGARDRPCRRHHAARGRLDARAQGDDGRSRRRVHRAARRHRHLRRAGSKPSRGRSSACTASRAACSTSPASTTTCCGSSNHAWTEGFIKPETRAIVRPSADPAALLDAARPA